jgi:probable F420-dependent oxidoreductase
MTAKNAVGADRRYWGFVPVLPGAFLLEMARQAEDSGLEGVFAAQVYGPPFLPLAVAAAGTQRLKVATGIAIAAARSPFETAMAALDMDRISSGRFILGLGSSVSSWTSGNFGAPHIKPVTHLRETVAAVRHIVEGAHEGLDPFEGTYFKAHFREMTKTPPPVREHIPIWIAALRETMTRLAAEIGDGVIGHPMWSVSWTVDEMKPAIEDALAQAGRQRSDIEVNIWPWVAPNPNEAEALNDSRPTIAFYAGIHQYEPFFAAHGFRKEARACQAGVQQGDYLSVVDQVPDEMVRTFVSLGDPDKVLEQLEPIWQIADSVLPVPPPYAVPADRQMLYAGRIAEMIARS